jgi:hypothetical protein
MNVDTRSQVASTRTADSCLPSAISGLNGIVMTTPERAHRLELPTCGKNPVGAALGH